VLNGCSKPIEIPITGSAEADIETILSGLRKDAAKEGKEGAYLLEVAVVLAKIDRAKGMVAFDEAAAAAKMMEIPSSREAVLLEIAEKVGALDPSRAVSIVTGNEIAFTRHGEDVLYAIVAAVAKADTAAALGLIDKLQLKRGRAAALFAVAREAANHDVAAARQILGTIPSAQRGQMTWELAQSIADKHPDAAVEIIAGINFQGGRAEPLLVLARKCREKHPDKAIALAGEAAAALKQSPMSPLRRAQALAEVAGLLASKDAGQAKVLLDEAEGLAGEVRDPGRRDAIRLEIVKARGEVDLAAAEALCGKLSYTYQANGFTALAESAKASAAEVRVDLLSRALSAVARIQSRERRKEALLRTAEAMATLSKSAATPLFEKAYGIAVQLAQSDPTIHLKVAVEMAKVNREAALAHFAEAAQGARSYGGAISKASALLDIAKHLAKADKAQGRLAFEEVFKLIEEGEQSTDLDRLRVRASTAGAKVCTAQAVAAAQKIPAAASRRETLLRIARALAGIEERPPSELLPQVIRMPMSF